MLHNPNQPHLKHILYTEGDHSRHWAMLVPRGAIQFSVLTSTLLSGSTFQVVTTLVVIIPLLPALNLFPLTLNPCPFVLSASDIPYLFASPFYISQSCSLLTSSPGRTDLTSPVSPHNWIAQSQAMSCWVPSAPSPVQYYHILPIPWWPELLTVLQPIFCLWDETNAQR